MLAKQLKMKQKNKKVDFLNILLYTLGATLLGNLSTGKGVKVKIPRPGVRRAGEGMIRAGQDF